MHKKISDFKTIIILCIIILAAILVFYIYNQSKYLSLRIFNQEITRIDLVEYKDKPFESEIISLKSLSGGSLSLNIIKQEMNMEDIKFFHPRISSKVLFFYYGGDKIVNAYVSNNKVGLNYGNVWIEVKSLDEILKEFK